MTIELGIIAGSDDLVFARITRNFYFSNGQTNGQLANQFLVSCSWSSTDTTVLNQNLDFIKNGLYLGDRIAHRLDLIGHAGTKKDGLYMNASGVVSLGWVGGKLVGEEHLANALKYCIDGVQVRLLLCEGSTSNRDVLRELRRAIVSRNAGATLLTSTALIVPNDFYLGGLRSSVELSLVQEDGTVASAAAPVASAGNLDGPRTSY